MPIMIQKATSIPSEEADTLMMIVESHITEMREQECSQIWVTIQYAEEGMIVVESRGRR